MNSLQVPDLNGWEAYCENCDQFRRVRKSASSDLADGTEYFEFVCVVRIAHVPSGESKGFLVNEPRYACAVGFFKP